MLVTGVQMYWHVYVVFYLILGACLLHLNKARLAVMVMRSWGHHHGCATVTHMFTGSSMRTGRLMWCPRRARRMQTQASASSAARTRSSSEGGMGHLYTSSLRGAGGAGGGARSSLSGSETPCRSETPQSDADCQTEDEVRLT